MVGTVCLLYVVWFVLSAIVSLPMVVAFLPVMAAMAIVLPVICVLAVPFLFDLVVKALASCFSRCRTSAQIKSLEKVERMDKTSLERALQARGLDITADASELKEAGYYEGADMDSYTEKVLKERLRLGIGTILTPNTRISAAEEKKLNNKALALLLKASVLQTLCLFTLALPLVGFYQYGTWSDHAKHLWYRYFYVDLDLDFGWPKILIGIFIRPKP